MTQKQYKTVLSANLFINDKGAAYASNSGWTPWKDGAPGDIHLRSNVKYSVQLYDNGDGKFNLKISEVTGYQSRDNIADGISQGGLKHVGEAINNQYQPATKDDDDEPNIPF